MAKFNSFQMNMLLYFIAISVTRKCGFPKRRQDNRLKKKKDIYSILEEINMIKDTKTNHALDYSDCTKEKIVCKIILIIGGGRKIKPFTATSRYSVHPNQKCRTYIQRSRKRKQYSKNY